MQKLNGMSTNTSKTKALSRNNYFANRIEYRVFSDALKLNCQVASGDAKADAHCL